MHRHSSPAVARSLKMKTLAVVIAASFAPCAVANPVGPTVAAGSAQFTASGNTLAIVNTPGTIINWQQFNIGQNEITKFIQQSNQSAVLNRITGQDPSQILGTLQSNGRVFLINPNGILFGQNAVIDVFGLVASNLNLANADFLAGRFSFGGGGAGAVVNQGAITTPVGGSVYLIGSNVTNQGLVTSPKGDVLLAAGNSVNLADTGTPNLSVTLSANGSKAVNLGRITAEGGRIDIYGALIDQQGILRADSAGVDAQGRIVLTATRSTGVAGEMSATNSAGVGGTVQVLGDDVSLASTAKIDASGATGGGTVLIGGDWQGKNAAVRNATTTSVSAGATIKADATERGNGGKVVVWSDDKTFFDGFIHARGGHNGGDGGAVETSGKTLSLNGRVDTTAAKGKVGNWLLDPASYCFYLSNSTECTSTGFNASNGWTMEIFDSLLMSSDVTVAATDYAAFLPAGGTFVGSGSVPAGRTLTVQTPYIYMNGNIDTGSSVGIALVASSQYGTSSFSGKTGVIDIAGGVLTSPTASLKASADINVGSPAGTKAAGLYMTSAAGTQSVVADGNINVVAGNSGSFVQSYIKSDGSQAITALNVNVKGGGGTGNSAGITAAGASQTLTASQTLSISGGSGTSSTAAIHKLSGGAQTITADAIAIIGGSSGTANSASISGTAGSQAIGANQIRLKAGAGGSSNGASIAGGEQVITLTGTNPLLDIEAGSGGDSNRASVSTSSTAVAAQRIIVKGGGGIRVSGGSSGSMKLSPGSIPHYGWTTQSNRTMNYASILAFSSGGQEIDFVDGGSLIVSGGTNGVGNTADVISRSGPQKIWSSTGSDPIITLTAGTSGNYNAAAILNGIPFSSVSSMATPMGLTQTINAKGLALTGGGSGANDYFNQAIVGLFSDGGSQKIKISGGGALSLTGGGGRGTVVQPSSDAMGWNPSFLSWGCPSGNCPQSNNIAVINSTGSQVFDFVNGGALNLTGGGAGVANGATIVANTFQTVTSGNGPAFYPAVTLKGGAGGQLNVAQIISNWGDPKGVAYDQTINAGSLALMGGGSGAADYGDMATIWTAMNSVGKQNVTISRGGSLTLKGGNGSGSSILVPGGKECGPESPCPVSRNSAELYNAGSGAQTLDFLAGGSLNLTGGNNGSYNRAQIWSNAPQTITSSNGAANYPAIAMTGGAGGYIDAKSGAHRTNRAEINPSDASNAPLTINASSITLNGGGTSTLHGGASIDADGTVTVTTTGAVTLNGGAGGTPAMTNPFNVEDDRSGSSVDIASETSLTLKVGTDLTIQAASGRSAPALIGSRGSLNVSVGGKTTISASASPVFIGTAPDGMVPASAGLVGIAPSSTAAFQTGSLEIDAVGIEFKGPVTASSSIRLQGDAIAVKAPVTAGTWVYAESGDFDLASTITANGSGNTSGVFNATGPNGHYLQAGLDVTGRFANHGGAISTPHGVWVVDLHPGAVGAADALGTGLLSATELLAKGYTWLSAPTPGSMFYDSAPVSPKSAGTATIVQQAVSDTCATNPALCTSSQQQQATVVAADATADSSAKGKVTVDEKLKNDKEAGKAEDKKTEDKKLAEEKKQPEDKKQVEQKAEVSKQKQEAKAAEERKSPAELKQEARQAQAEAKKVEAEAKQAQAEARKVEAEAKQAASAAKKAETEAKKAETEAKKAEADIKTAKTPERKAGAEARKAEAESKQAEAEAKKIDAEAKQAQAASKKNEAEAKQATHDAKQAEAEHKLALAEAKEAASPEAKAAAQGKAAEKQVEATRKKAEGEVKQSQAEEHKAAAATKKVEAEAKQAEHDAKRAEAGAKKAEAEATRAKQAGKPEEEKKALAQKAEHEKQAEASHKQAEAKQADANAKKVEHEKLAQERRGQAAKAFARAALAAMMPDRLAHMAALRHEHKTELLKPALSILEQNPKAADLPPCGAGGGDVCVPVKAAVAEAARQGAAAVPKPTLSFVPRIERKVAVLVGINKYADKSIPPLESAVPDVEAVAKVMQDKLGYDVRIVRDATKADIVRALNGVGKEVGPNDSVAIYYAGHGYLSEKANSGYWIPSDSSVLEPSKWISNDDVARLLQQIPAKQVMLVSDSCYSGSLTREGKVGAGGGNLDDILGKRSVTVMSSGGEEPVSDEGKEGHSIFAWSLMEALKKVDRYEPGAKLFDNVKRNVVEEFPQVPQYGAAPSAGHAAGGDYLLEVRSYK